MGGHPNDPDECFHHENIKAWQYDAPRCPPGKSVCRNRPQLNAEEPLVCGSTLPSKAQNFKASGRSNECCRKSHWNVPRNVYACSRSYSPDSPHFNDRYFDLAPAPAASTIPPCGRPRSHGRAIFGARKSPGHRADRVPSSMPPPLMSSPPSPPSPPTQPHRSHAPACAQPLPALAGRELREDYSARSAKYASAPAKPSSGAVVFVVDALDVHERSEEVALVVECLDNEKRAPRGVERPHEQDVNGHRFRWRRPVCRRLRSAPYPGPTPHTRRRRVKWSDSGSSEVPTTPSSNGWTGCCVEKVHILDLHTPTRTPYARVPTLAHQRLHAKLLRNVPELRGVCRGACNAECPPSPPLAPRRVSRVGEESREWLFLDTPAGARLCATSSAARSLHRRDGHTGMGARGSATCACTPHERASPLPPPLPFFPGAGAWPSSRGRFPVFNFPRPNLCRQFLASNSTRVNPLRPSPWPQIPASKSTPCGQILAGRSLRANAHGRGKGAVGGRAARRQSRPGDPETIPQSSRGKLILTLPPKDIEIVKLRFTDEERELYESFEKRAKIRLNRFIRDGTLVKKFLINSKTMHEINVSLSAVVVHIHCVERRRTLMEVEDFMVERAERPTAAAFLLRGFLDFGRSAHRARTLKIEYTVHCSSSDGIKEELWTAVNRSGHAA
ncbi:hypothetical protein DFH07DRAFT_776321 [Mycena maculata]|uniref:Uncharacterized protein n=1 Tax=Mycena maculata TaxID=230809 RepID=A0AAD7IMT8_9AGAR|nr:hypothetical protein DFH07DRAFT_776321 [Mycena maculata]